MVSDKDQLTPPGHHSTYLLDQFESSEPSRAIVSVSETSVPPSKVLMVSDTDQLTPLPLATILHNSCVCLNLLSLRGP